MTHRREAGSAQSTVIMREIAYRAANVGAGTALSNAIEVSDFAGGLLITPSSLDNNTAIGFKVSDREDGVFYSLFGSDGVLITIPVSIANARAYPLPDELFGAHWIKIWTCTTGGLDVNQASVRGFGLMMKG